MKIVIVLLVLLGIYLLQQYFQKAEDTSPKGENKVEIIEPESAVKPTKEEKIKPLENEKPAVVKKVKSTQDDIDISHLMKQEENVLIDEKISIPSQTKQHLKEFKEMQLHEKNTLLHQQTTQQSKDWEVDYSISLEEGSLEKVKEGVVQTDMFNTKITFEKKF
jgi:hypothetical protein